MGEGGARCGRLDPNACEPSLRARPFAVPAASRCGRRPPWCARARALHGARRASTGVSHRRLGCAVKDLRVGDVVVYQSPIDHQKTVIKRIAALVGTLSAHGCGATPERAPGGAACVPGVPVEPRQITTGASPRALTSGNRTANSSPRERGAQHGSPGADVGRGAAGPGADVAGVGPVPADMRHGCAKSRCRGGRGQAQSRR